MRTFITLLLLTCSLHSSSDFGYISCSGFNLGDDIQAIASQQFIPKKSIGIDREFVGVFKHKKVINTIVNGCYQHTKNNSWYRTDVPAPEVSWPPSSSINPLLISIYFSKGFSTLAFTNENIEYLKKHAPIGARDLFTLKRLQERNIPSYFSGCLTLTLPRSKQKRQNIIYAVDLDEECINYIKAHTRHTVISISPIISREESLNPALRLKKTKELLAKYGTAKCVVTCRLHGSLPCLALQTPVVLINTQPDQYRFDGLRELVHNCSKEEFLSGKLKFDFDNPPENPKKYLPLRKQLIKNVSDWVKAQSQ